jgi:hypothetical protein
MSEHHWSTIELNVDQHGGVTIISDNRPSEQIQSIENIVNPEDSAQEDDGEPVNLNALVPSRDDHTTLLSLNGLVDSDSSIPDIDNYATSSSLDDSAVDKVPNFYG